MAITEFKDNYRNDNTSVAHFENSNNYKSGSTPKQSPLHTSLKRKDAQGGAVKGWAAHSFGEINPYKVCEVAITTFNSGKPLKSTSGLWGNWRDAGIYDQVYLWPETKNWDFAFSNTYESAYAKLDQMGLLSKISQINEGLRSAAMVMGGTLSQNTPNGGRMISKYREAPAWSGTKPLALSSNITFNFRFGQAGLFDAKQEVVDPIMALAVQFAPYMKDENYAIGPSPTAPSFFFAFMDSLAGEGGLGGKIWDAVKSGRDANNNESGEEEGSTLGSKMMGVTTILTDIEQTIITHMNTTIAKVLNGEDKRFGDGTTCLNLKIGHIITPPMIVKDVSWSFDMTHTDENGYPTAGKLTFGGLESLVIATAGEIQGLIQ